MGITLLRKVEVVPPEDLECKFSMVQKQVEDIPPILVVSFVGNYPDGSAGNRHGRYMASMTLLGLSEFEPWCVILDLRNLEYRWGNALLQVFQNVSAFMSKENEAGDPPFPVIAVTSEKSRSGFLSLVTPSDGEEPAWHWNSLSEAVEAAVVAANHWIDG